MINLLLENIRQQVPLTTAEADLIDSYFRKNHYPRHALLIRAGEIAHELFFILSGTAHQYYIDDTGNERTCQFGFEQDFMTDLDSFSRQAPATSSIAALTSVACYSIGCTEIRELMARSVPFKSFLLALTEKIARQNIRRIQTLLSLTPEQRYNQILEERPEIIQRIPQRYIAQYLGIAPESLSRIRKRMYAATKT